MAHEKVYAQCENMCLEETLTKEQLFSEFLSMSRIWRIDTFIEMTGDSFTKYIDLPEGWTSDNCMIFSYDFADEYFFPGFTLELKSNQVKVNFTPCCRDETVVGFLYVWLLKTTLD